MTRAGLSCLHMFKVITTVSVVRSLPYGRYVSLEGEEVASKTSKWHLDVQTVRSSLHSSRFARSKGRGEMRARSMRVREAVPANHSRTVKQPPPFPFERNRRKGAPAPEQVLLDWSEAPVGQNNSNKKRPRVGNKVSDPIRA
jgi:hypothetical protein